MSQKFFTHSGKIESIPLFALPLVALIPALAVSVSGNADGPDRELFDKFVIITWILVAAILGVAFIYLVRPRSPLENKSTGIQLTMKMLSTISIVVILWSVTWGNDLTNFWAGVSPLNMVIGAVLAVFLVWAHIGSKGMRFALMLGLTGFITAFVLPALLQFPLAIRDPYHFFFTSDELAAVAAGKFPLSDFIPQYSTLLGFPIAPFILLTTKHADLVVTVWILILQLGVFAAAGGLAFSATRSRAYVASAITLVMVTSVTAMSTGVSSSTYFQIMPLRIVLPLGTLLVGFWALKMGGSKKINSGIKLLLAGFASGISALNNPDFGIPVVVVLALAVVTVSLPKFQFVITQLATFATGTIAPFVGYWLIGIITGNPVHWSFLLIFQREFAIENFVSAPMDAFGLHIAVAGLFVIASATGFVMLVRGKGIPKSFQYRAGLALFLAGGWSLLTLAYFSNRSLTPTLISGTAVQAGLVMSLLLPLFVYNIRMARAGHKGNQVTRGTSMVLAFLGLSVIFTGIFTLEAPSKYLSTTFASVNPTFQDVLAALKQPSPYLAGEISNVQSTFSDVGRTREDSSVQQIVLQSNLVALSTGIPSAAISSSTDYLTFFASFRSLQCQAFQKSQANQVIVNEAAYLALSSEPTCEGTISAATTPVKIEINSSIYYVIHILHEQAIHQ